MKQVNLKAPTIDLDLNNVIKFLIFGLVFLFPLFFGLKTITNLDFNKQMLLIVVSVIAVILWFIKNAGSGEVNLRLSWIHVLGLGFVVSVLVSTILSRWTWGSFWGWPLDTNENFSLLLSFFVFYLIVSNFLEEKDLFEVQSWLVGSAFLIGLWGILQLYGVFVLPLQSTRFTGFNTIGTVNSWGLFLASLIPVSLALFFASKGYKKVLFSIATLVLFAGLVVANYINIWIAILIAMAFFMFLALWKTKKADQKLLMVPTTIIALALIIGIFRIPIPGLPVTPLEVTPSLKATIDTVLGMAKSSIKDLAFGWGPGTFKYGWSKFKDTSLNQTIFWNIRFLRGRNEMVQLPGTIGLVGTVVYLSLMGFAIVKGLKGMPRLEDDKDEKKQGFWLLALGILSSFVALTAAKFLQPKNVTIDFLWWFFLANIVVLTVKRTKPLKLEADSKINFVFSFVTILVLIGGIFFLYLEGTRYWAEIKYVQAVTRPVNFQTARNILLQAIRLNPQEEIFWQDLAQVYLLQKDREILRTDISNEQKSQTVANLIANAVAASRRATEINPFNVANWQVLGATYRQIIALSQGAFDWSVRSYEKALDLEPTNPFILVELGRSYLTQARITQDATERDSRLQRAQEYFRRAMDMKPDYARAYYQMALVYEAQGKREEAISTLENIKAMAPFLVDYNPLNDVGLAFQLGILYRLNGDNDKAQAEFERAVSINPNYSNARYFLGLIYDQKGETAKAIAQFEVIEKLNPDNQEIKKILANLRNGEPALKGVVSTGETVPIEEKPEEK
jgi:tetratricopeptide (TPR) repeat protein